MWFGFCLNGSRTIAPDDNYAPAPKLGLTLAQTVGQTALSEAYVKTNRMESTK